MKLNLFLFFSCFWITNLSSADKAIPKQVQLFMKEYCISCHGPKKEKADFRVDHLSLIKNAVHAEQWQLVLDNLHLADMPPEDEKQPPIKEVTKVTDWIEEELREARKVLKGHTGEVVFRRLNKEEYQNTIEDLFGLYGDFTDAFPDDAKEDGFSNNGAALMLSATQIKAYLDAADKILNKAIKTKDKPKTIKETFTLNDKNKSDWERQPKTRERSRERLAKLPPKEKKKFFEQEEKYKKNLYWNFIYPAYENGKLRAPRPDDSPNTDYAYYRKNFGYQDPSPKTYIREEGRYRFTITGYAANTSGEDIRVKVVYGNLNKPGVIPKLAGYAFFKHNKPTTTSFDFHLAPGDKVRVVEASQGSKWMRHEESVNYDGPMSIIRSMAFEGPFTEDWPGKGHKNLLGNLQSKDLKDEHIKALLESFAPKLFRRSVSSSLIEKYHSHYQNFRKSEEPLEAYKSTLKTMMVSPHFLYHNEGDSNIDDESLASRLSYFLWRSTPDEELLKLAGQSKLSQPSILKYQITRMIKDTKSQRFIEDFANQWLQVSKIGEMRPDKQLYPNYDEQLEEAMIEETRGYLSRMFYENLGLDQLIDSDWTILNERLAKHYEIDQVKGLNFRPVKLDKSKTIRGGLLTQASILNLTSNGTTTSPVVRGVWILDHFLGTPSPPPPPDVPPIEPDIRGATTIKEQLKKHREIETCRECHKKIDPFGVALENFDVTGAWRSEYAALKTNEKNKRQYLTKGQKVEVSDSIPKMGEYQSFQEFREILKNQKDKVYHNMAHKLATFALGRSLDFSDRDYLHDIVKSTHKRGNGLQTMVYELIQNPIFRKP